MPRRRRPAPSCAAVVVVVVLGPPSGAAGARQLPHEPADERPVLGIPGRGHRGETESLRDEDDDGTQRPERSEWSVAAAGHPCQGSDTTGSGTADA